MSEKAFYVSVFDPSSNAGHGRVSLALGPFPLHGAAVDSVDRVRAYVSNMSPWAAFWSFGTCSLPAASDNPVGKLNAVLSLS